MTHDLTHASFFSGVGGLDLGLERAGWRTVSFSEIDPYASAVLAERWPGVPNLGDIVELSTHGRKPIARHDAGSSSIAPRSVRWGCGLVGSGAASATLWSGGFPCQDLSVAGKRAGFAGERSSLAFAFLDLVERYRPPAILLENVPGLLSSHRGRDFGTLLDRLAQLRYGWAYRILDARHFGVPQRRRRVFIVALDTERGLGAERAAEVLSVGSRCHRHPAAGVEAGPGAADGVGAGAVLAREGKGVGHNFPDDHLIAGYGSAADGATSTRTLGAAMGHHGYTMGAQDADGGYLQVVGDDQSVARAIHASTGRRSGPAGDEVSNLIRQAPDPGGVRAPDGLAGRLDDLAPTLRVGPARPQDGGPGDTVPIVYTKSRRAQTSDDDETWVGGEVMPTLNSFDVGDVRTTAAIIGQGPQDDPLLPLGLDSHRYRCCGNGVVAPVAEWLGIRLREAL